MAHRPFNVNKNRESVMADWIGEYVAGDGEFVAGDGIYGEVGAETKGVRRPPAGMAKAWPTTVGYDSTDAFVVGDNTKVITVQQTFLLKVMCVDRTLAANCGLRQITWGNTNLMSGGVMPADYFTADNPQPFRFEGIPVTPRGQTFTVTMYSNAIKAAGLVLIGFAGIAYAGNGPA
jgi:hypothetical protein